MPVATSLFFATEHPSFQRFKSFTYWYNHTWLELTLNLHVFAVHASELCALRVLQCCSGSCLQSILQKIKSRWEEFFLSVRIVPNLQMGLRKRLDSLSTQSWWEFSKSCKSRTSYLWVAPFCPCLLPQNTASGLPTASRWAAAAMAVRGRQSGCSHSMS